ncbi:MAG: mechanosensitive ion channel family protein [Persicimonas sp.]
MRRIEIPVQVAYSTDLGQAHDVLRGVMRDHTAVLDEPAPVVLTDLLADSGVNLLIRAWVIRTDFVQAKSDLTTAVKEALEEADIQIPFPQRVIHHVNTASEPTAQPQKSVGSARIEAPEQV